MCQFKDVQIIIGLVRTDYRLYADLMCNWLGVHWGRNMTRSEEVVLLIPPPPYGV